MYKPETLRFTAADCDLSATLLHPDGARWVFVYGHGAGAGMNHAFMEASAEGFARAGLATLRFNFPFTEGGRRRPDHKNKLLPTIRAAVALAREHCPNCSIAAGGKSMGGRMTSLLAAHDLEVDALVFVGFPLHQPGAPSRTRAEHLPFITAPMLFLQGTRDKLADLDLITATTDELGELATLHVVEGADHGFHVLKRSGRTDAEVIEELSSTAATWLNSL